MVVMVSSKVSSRFEKVVRPSNREDIDYHHRGQLGLVSMRPLSAQEGSSLLSCSTEVPVKAPICLTAPDQSEYSIRRVKLVDHSVRSCLDRIRRMAHPLGRAHHQHPCTGVYRPQHSEELEAVPVGQPAVEECNVHIFAHRACFGERTCRTHHLKVWLALQQADQDAPE